MHLIGREVKCVGQFFLDREDRHHARDLEDATEITVVHETENEADEYAAACYHDGTKIGYIQKEFSPVCVLLLQSGKEVRGVISGRAKNSQSHPLLTLFVED